MRRYHSPLRQIGSQSGSRFCRPRVEWMEARTLLSAVFWTGTAGDNNWDTPANWNDEAVPGPTDDVTIDTRANVVHSGGRHRHDQQPESSATVDRSPAGRSVGWRLRGHQRHRHNDRQRRYHPQSGRRRFRPRWRYAHQSRRPDRHLLRLRRRSSEAGGTEFVNDGTFLAKALGGVSETGNRGNPISFTNNGTFTARSDASDSSSIAWRSRSTRRARSTFRRAPSTSGAAARARAAASRSSPGPCCLRQCRTVHARQRDDPQWHGNRDGGRG